MVDRRPLIAGNWKMNGTRAEADALCTALLEKLATRDAHRFEMLVCPPSTLCAHVALMVGDTPLRLGAQDCHAREKGSHTGDISAPMLADLGCDYVILGHSERRTDHGESDDHIRAKTESAFSARLVAIVCLGETETERDEGKTLNVIAGQIAGSLPDGITAGNTVIAYEPVWAIGTGRAAAPEEVQEVHAHIRDCLASRFGEDCAQGIRILYGGSMKPANARTLLALPDVDGGLIGGASLIADDFWAIAESVPE